MKRHLHRISHSNQRLSRVRRRRTLSRKRAARSKLSGLKKRKNLSRGNFRFSSKGGALPFGKTNCEKLFAMKGTNKWKDLQNISMRTRLNYSICKRAQSSLYKAYKASKTGQLLKSKDGRNRQPGVVFDPLIKGKDQKTIEINKEAELEVHKWLDSHGWTDKNIAQAKKIKEQRIKELSLIKQ